MRIRGIGNIINFNPDTGEVATYIPGLSIPVITERPATPTDQKESPGEKAKPEPTEPKKGISNKLLIGGIAAAIALLFIIKK
jgi:hypothetical protein